MRVFCVLLGCALLGLASPAYAKEKVTVVGSAQATVVDRLGIVKNRDLNFGRIIPGATAGTVVLSPAGVRSATGGARLATGPSSTASFSGFGSNNQTITLAIASATSTLTRAGGGGSMTMDTFTVGSTPTAIISTTPLGFRVNSPTGIFTFPVGATLRVGANQAPGTYTGTFTVIISYL
jgi:Domain of unknown function (DUF4402)